MKLWIGILLVLFLISLLFQIQARPYILPKIVWTHWDSPNPPEHVLKNINQMKEMLPDWEVKFLTTGEFLASISSKEVPANFDTLGVAHQADWIRLKLLEKYGGCWMDSGIILNSSLNPLYREAAKAKADLLVFTMGGMQTRPEYPIAENWFILAPQGSPVIQLWLQEFEKAIDTGFHTYKKQIKQEGVDLQKLMNNPTDVYLTQHGCFQKVLQQRLPPHSKILYHRSEDTMFKIHVDCKWDATCIRQTLQNTEYCKTIPYIKLRGADRKGL